jgi:predicted enzyme involved in methoxymalonyl-ACP biosynthesis
VIMQTQDTSEAQTTKNKQSNFALDMHQWSAIVKQWDRTKESQKAYCNRLNLNINTFCYVKAKLKQKHIVSAKFIPVTIEPHESMVSTNSSLCFENKRGIKLQVPLSIKENVLLKLLKLIGWNHA